MESVKIRGLSNSSYRLFERKTNHVSTSIQITGGFSRGQINLLWPPSLLHKSRSDLRRFGGRLQREMSQAFKQQKRKYDISAVVSMIFYFHPYILGERIQFDDIIFSGGVGWNHQPDMDCENFQYLLGDNYVLFSAPQNIPESKHQTPQVRYDRWSTQESLLNKTPVDWVGFLSKGMKNYSVILGIIMSHDKNPY